MEIICLPWALIAVSNICLFFKTKTGKWHNKTHLCPQENAVSHFYGTLICPCSLFDVNKPEILDFFSHHWNLLVQFIDVFTAAVTQRTHLRHKNREVKVLTRPLRKTTNYGATKTCGTGCMRKYMFDFLFSYHVTAHTAKSHQGCGIYGGLAM